MYNLASETPNKNTSFTDVFCDFSYTILHIIFLASFSFLHQFAKKGKSAALFLFFFLLYLYQQSSCPWCILYIFLVYIFFRTYYRNWTTVMCWGCAGVSDDFEIFFAVYHLPNTRVHIISRHEQTCCFHGFPLFCSLNVHHWLNFASTVRLAFLLAFF